MQAKNEFYLYGVVNYFDENPMKRLLLLEYPGPYQPSCNSTCPIFVRGNCVLPSDKDIEPGQKVFVVGQITDTFVGKTRVPRLIADKIFRDDEWQTAFVKNQFINANELRKKLEEAEGRVMLVHSGANEDDRDDLVHVINLLNEVMAELKGGIE